MKPFFVFAILIACGNSSAQEITVLNCVGKFKSGELHEFKASWIGTKPEYIEAGGDKYPGDDNMFTYSIALFSPVTIRLCDTRKREGATAYCTEIDRISGKYRYIKSDDGTAKISGNCTKAPPQKAKF